MADLDRFFVVADQMLALRAERTAHQVRVSEINEEMAKLLEIARQLLAESANNGEGQVAQHQIKDLITHQPEPFARKFEPIPTPKNLTKSPIRNQVIAYFRDRKGQTVTTEELANALSSIKRQSLFWTLSHLRSDGVLERIRRGVWRLKEGGLEALEESRAF